MNNLFFNKNQILVFLLICITCCTQKNQYSESKKSNKIESNVDIVRQFSSHDSKNVLQKFNDQKSDSIFKLWLNDTLKTLNLKHDKKERYLKEHKIIVRDDSLNLQIIKSYFARINPKLHYTGNVGCIIELLEEYNEKPKNNFTLKIIYVEDYYHSQVEQLRSEYQCSYDKIIVNVDGSISEYSYIRGRLSGKIFYSLKDKERKQTGVDFIWDNNNKFHKDTFELNKIDN